MLPSPDDVARAAREVAPHESDPIAIREGAVRSALREAEHLVEDDVDVPAALHFTFTRHKGVFSRLSGQVLARVLTDTGARLGIKIMATDAELRARLEQIPESVEDAREWFSSRVVMFGG